MQHTTNPWFITKQHQPRATHRLICFPYAGGSASVFQPWHSLSSADLEVVAVQLPGRENRFVEPLIHDMPTLIDQLESNIAHLLDKPLIFFGHSLGAIVCYELIQRLQARNNNPVKLAIFSGCRPPHRYDVEQISHLPNLQFMQMLAKRGGVPNVIMEDTELMELVAPILKADFGMAENYRCQSRQKLFCHIATLYGQKDPFATGEQVTAWQELVAPEFNTQCKAFANDHFFVNSNAEQVMAYTQSLIDEQLLNQPSIA